MARYLEIFVGNGGIVRNLRLPGNVIISDLDSNVIKAWEKMQNKGHYKKVQLVHGNGLDLFRQYRYDDTATFVYCDPPYRIDSRKNDKDLYRFEWDDEDHKEFLSMAVTASCNVMISHYPDEMYDEKLFGWHTVDFKAMTRSGLANERIYMNYPPPFILQDYRYLGKDYRERELIKKKTISMMGKIKALPHNQRAAILSAVIATYKDTASKIMFTH